MVLPWVASSRKSASRQRRAPCVLDDELVSPPEALLTAREVAASGGPATKTLANWRSLRKGPTFVRHGRFIRYPRGAYLDWLRSHQVRTR
jgi:hypothetical protein